MGARSSFASDGVRSLLARNNLTDLDGVFERGAGAPHRHSGRCVWDASLIDRDGDRVHIYVKMNWGRRRLWPRTTDLKTGQWLQSLPVREWHGIAALERLGINVPGRLALLHEGLARFRAAVIVRAIPPSASVFDMLHSGEWARLQTGRRRQILQSIADVMRTIHSAGLGWRGTSTGHFYPEPAGEGTCRTWVIDCEGVHRRATQKTFDRDDRKLIRSFELAGADDETLAALADLLRANRYGGMRRAA